MKSYIDVDKSRASNKYTSRAENRINGHIILVKYFIERTCTKVSTQTMAFMEAIESQDRNQKKRNNCTGREPKEEIESVYTISDRNTIKQYNEVAYDQKLKELRNLIVDAKNNFDDDVYRRLLIRVNNCIFSNSKHGRDGSNTDLIVNPDDIDDTYRLEGLFNTVVSAKIKKTFDHAWKLRVCMKELLSISHGDFDQILCDVKDLMKPVLEQSDKELNPTMNPPQNPQAEPSTNKARNIHDIFLARYSFASYASGEGVVELSAEEMRKINQYTEDIKKGSNEELNKFIKKIEEVRTTLMIAVDNLDHEIFKKYVSEGKVEVLKKYLHVAGQYFEITAGILKKLGYKDELEGEDLVAKKLKRIEKILNQNTQNQNGQLLVEAQSPTVSAPKKDLQNGTKTITEQVVSPPEVVIPIPGQGINNKSNPQTTHHRSQSKPNFHGNKSFGKEIMGVVGAIVGMIIGATIAYLAGAALPIIVAIGVFSGIASALICYGIAEICEKVSREKQNDPKIGTLTALREVITTKWLNGNVDIAI